jgi:uncharacterized protein (DUF305 family)
MKKSQEDEIIYKVQLLEELIDKHQEALKMANNLLNLKDKLVELCEAEIEIYKRENKRLRTSLIVSGVIFTILAVISIIQLFL